jgi:hypothetical protein
MISVQLIPNNTAKMHNNSAKILNKLIWMVDKQWDLKSTNQLKAVPKWRTLQIASKQNNTACSLKTHSCMFYPNCTQNHPIAYTRSIRYYNYTSGINNGNWTEWSAIWTEIKRVITKSHDREAGVRFVITSLISVQNCTTRSSISTLLYSFWNLN